MKIDDYDSVVDVWKQAGLRYGPKGRDSREAIGRQLSKQGRLMLVAEEAGRITGVVIGSHDYRKGWINRVAVLPERRRTGVAKALVRRIEKEFDKMNLPVFCSLIYADNTASRALFDSLGYTVMDEVKYYSKRPGWDV